MSIIKSIKQALGLSGTASENHFWDGSVPNQLSLKRGTPDAPGTTLMSFIAGVLSLPAQVTPTFTATVNASSTSTGPTNIGGITVVNNNLLGTWVGNKYTPLRAGYYLVIFTLGAQAGTALSFNALFVARNGADVLTAVGPPYATMYSRATATGMVYMNGTTDYMEFIQDISGTGALSVLAGTIHVRHMGDL